MKEDQAAASQKRILRVEEGRVLGERALCGIGFSSEEARIITDHLIDAALCGYDFAGLPRILTIAEDPRTRQARRQSCFHWGARVPHWARIRSPWVFLPAAVPSYSIWAPRR